MINGQIDISGRRRDAILGTHKERVNKNTGNTVSMPVEIRVLTGCFRNLSAVGKSLPEQFFQGC